MDDTLTRRGAGANSRRIVRVKSGCRTCRIRRVKCDEIRPSCSRCVQTGRTCDGYGIWNSGNQPGQNWLENPSIPAFVHTSVAGLAGPDKQLFEWFIREAIGKFNGVPEFPFWAKAMLQMCTTESVVLHTALAVASAHRAEMINAGCLLISGSRQSQKTAMAESETLQRYNKSIVLLRAELSRQTTASIRVAIASCILFICMEYIRRRFESGYRHLQCGLSLLKQISPRPSTTDPSSSDSGLSTDPLVDVLSRLDIQSKLLKNELHPGLCSQIFGSNEGIPSSFSSLREARHHLNKLLATAHNLELECQKYGPTYNFTNPFELLCGQKCLRNDLVSWTQSFNSLKVNNGALLSQEKLAHDVLPIYHTLAYVITEIALQPGDECVFDKYTKQFKFIVESSKEILNTYLPTILAEMLSGHCTARFSFIADWGLIPPLYFVSLKCRDPRIRRKAIDLLANSLHREGIWDGPTAAVIASEVVRLEEVNLYKDHFQQLHATEGSACAKVITDLLSPTTLPENCRISNIEVCLPDGPTDELSFMGKAKRSDGSFEGFTRYYDGKSWSWKSKHD
ncbi:C6 zinc finger domain protein [Colletotrichum truncatum]|uniref:C6 zinc finger domain protein n=1 Tax=Colletotrichum truncatum TaxID=5467 RepID=A0ACC3Z975_COLTU